MLTTERYRSLEFYRKTKRIAYVKHRCWRCLTDIKVGTLHLEIVGKHESQFFAVRECLVKCSDNGGK